MGKTRKMNGVQCTFVHGERNSGQKIHTHTHTQTHRHYKDLSTFQQKTNIYFAIIRFNGYLLVIRYLCFRFRWQVLTFM